MEPLEHLACIMPLLEDADRFVILYQAAAPLADRLKSLKGKERIDDPPQKTRLRDFATEQEEIRTDLGQAARRIEEPCRPLPDDPKLEEFRKSILDFVDAVRDSGAAEAMQKRRRHWPNLSGNRGYTAATRPPISWRSSSTRLGPARHGRSWPGLLEV